VKRRVVIVGGGIAGLAAAVRIAEAGHTPIVLETRKKLGGRATSFVDPRTGDVLDNCQHVLMGCCTNLIDFYERLGVDDRIDWHRTLYWTRGGGAIDVMRSDWLPAPLHLGRSFARLRTFTRAQRRHIARGMWAMIRMGAASAQRHRDQTFAECLEAWGQPDDVIRDFWNTVIVGACNIDVWHVAAPYALQVFQEGFLANRWSYVMGLSTVPLANLYDPAEAVITGAGGEIRMGVSVRSIRYDGQRVRGVVTSDDVVDGEVVIAAVPPDRLDAIVGDAMRRADARLQRLREFEFSPILGVHLYFERAIMEIPHLVLVDTATHWLFNRGIDEAGGQWIHAVISAADAWMPVSEAEIVDRICADIDGAFPASAGARPLKARAVKEKRATFAATRAVQNLRPSTVPGTIGIAGGGIENLFLAGDWTDTGWPATMEGAVRSGYAAAAACCDHGGVVEDIHTEWLARWLGVGA